MDKLRSEIVVLFQAFLPEELASRWKAIVLKSPAQWSKIDPWKVWGALDPSRMNEWQGTVSPRTKEMIWDSRIAPYRSKQVVVLACGHSRPLLQVVNLDAALPATGATPFLEGFVSIVPGKLGLAVNHDGEIIVLQRQT